MKEKIVFAVKLFLYFALVFGVLTFALWDKAENGGTFGHVGQVEKQ